MGEIGIDKNQFLRDLRMWEILAIRKGYERRVVKSWETARFLGYCVVKSSMGGAPKVRTLQDLIKLPSDTDEDIDPKTLPSDEEIERLQNEIREYNKKHHKQ